MVNASQLSHTILYKVGNMAIIDVPEEMNYADAQDPMRVFVFREVGQIAVGLVEITFGNQT